MSEFKVHHLLSQLFKQINVSEGAEKYTEKLVKQSSSNPVHLNKMSAHSIVKKLAEKAPDPTKFYMKYEILRQQQLKELDSLLIFMETVSGDEKLQKLLGINKDDKTIRRLSGVSITESSPIAKLKVAEALIPSPSRSRSIDFKLRKPGDEDSIEMAAPLQNRPLRLSFEGEFQTGNFDVNDVPLQEYAIIEDLLNVMFGIDGVNLKIERSSLTGDGFRISKLVDASLKEMVCRITPIATYYMNIQAFVDAHGEFRFGYTHHALSAAIDAILKDYYLLVGQLDSLFRKGELTMQRFWFYVQPMFMQMKALDGLIHGIENSGCNGGALLSLLYDRVSSLSGDATFKQITNFLLEKASAPYFQMLENWIKFGIVDDPYNEFMIKEQAQYKKEDLIDDFNDIYWNQRYILVNERVPTFLEKYQEKILLSGKCLNVVRECDLKIPKSDLHLEFTLEERKYFTLIDQANLVANAKLIEVLKDKQLIEHLNSLAQFFLIQQGDYIVHFMDIANDELLKEAKDVSLAKLQSLMELALRSSCSLGNSLYDNVKCYISSDSLIDYLLNILSITGNDQDLTMTDTVAKRKLYGYDAFSLDYETDFPCSLIISRKSIVKYQMLFRHLFRCKYIEKQLCSSWSSFQFAKKVNKDIMNSPSFRKADSLRQRMLNFIQNIHYYSSVEVIEPNWRKLQSKWENIDSMDNVLKHHSDFLDTCLKECMLTNPKLLIIFDKLMTSCLEFFQDFESWIQAKVTTEFKESPISDFETNLIKLDQEFMANSRKLVEQLEFFTATDYEHHMANLICRLDYNYYYTNK